MSDAPREIANFAGLADREEIARLLISTVDIPSVNPALDGGPGEAALAAAVAVHLRDLGLEPSMENVLPGGRDNVVARMPGAPGAPSLLFEAHLDTVVPSGLAQTKAVVDAGGGRIRGRGACDTKGSLVAMLEALRILRDHGNRRHAAVFFAGAVDEEVAGRGASALAAAHPEIDMAIVGEPTSLRAAIAHKGVVRFRITVDGTAAHSSRPELGVNAIHGMARVLDAVERHVIPALDPHGHPLTGPPTLSVSTITGGTAENIVPASCTISVDRRLVPGETAASALAEVDRVLDQLRAGGIAVTRHEPHLVTTPLDTPPDHPVVAALLASATALQGVAHDPVGVTYGSDGSMFGPAGIPTVVFGPGDIACAHSDDEWVDVEETAVAAEILAGAASRLGL